MPLYIRSTYREGLNPWKTFTLEVRDQSGNTARKTFTLTINPPRPLTINNQGSTLIDGTVGNPYSAGLFGDGGTRPYSWAIIAGQLPPGLTLNGDSISGTPTTAGSFVFTARVTDSVGAQDSREFTITVR